MSVEIVTQLRTKHVNDFNSGDLAGMAEQISEDGVSMPPNQSAILGKSGTLEFLKEGLAAASTHMDIEPQELVVTDDYAIDHFDWVQQITTDGKTSEDRGNCIWVWRKESDGQWRLWKAIWNSDLEGQNVWTGSR